MVQKVFIKWERRSHVLSFTSYSMCLEGSGASHPEQWYSKIIELRRHTAAVKGAFVTQLKTTDDIGIREENSECCIGLQSIFSRRRWMTSLWHLNRACWAEERTGEGHVLQIPQCTHTVVRQTPGQVGSSGAHNLTKCYVSFEYTLNVSQRLTVVLSPPVWNSCKGLASVCSIIIAWL